MTLISCLPAAERVSLRYLSVNHELLITVEDDHNGTVSCDDKDQDAFEGFFWVFQELLVAGKDNHNKNSVRCRKWLCYSSTEENGCDSNVICWVTLISVENENS